MPSLRQVRSTPSPKTLEEPRLVHAIFILGSN